LVSVEQVSRGRDRGVHPARMGRRRVSGSGVRGEWSFLSFELGMGGVGLSLGFGPGSRTSEDNEV
jgi:hypothetical protein